MIQARNYTRTTGRQIDLIVVHDMEAPETSATAENVARWFAGDNAPKASAHWCFDNDSAVRCVADRDVAWHAPGANHNGLGYEHAGYARQTRAEWLDQYGVTMLERSALQARIDCETYDLPIVFRTADDLVAGGARGRGITTHWEVTKAFRRSTHWDPGHGFPMDWWLAKIKGVPVYGVPKNPTGNVAGSARTLRRGSTGDDVRAWQKILAGAGLLPASGVDGVFGPKTEAATRTMQQTLGVDVDGIVGAQTRAATARLLAWLAATVKRRPTVPPFPGTVRRGSTGPAVGAVQARLRDRGWRISVDRVFGPATERVVRAYQAEKRLEVDGIVGPATWASLWVDPVT